MHNFYLSRALAPVLLLVFALSAIAQQGTPVTAADYERAEKFLSYNTDPLVDRGPVRPNWLAGDRFWYRTMTPTGSEFILVDPARGPRAPAFDHAKLAAALSAASGRKFEGTRLPFTTIEVSPDGNSITVSAAGKMMDMRYHGLRTCACLGTTPSGLRSAARGPSKFCRPTKNARPLSETSIYGSAIR